jgi:hypothetical protein
MSSYYFASHRSTANPNSKEIDLLSPKQEKRISKKEKTVSPVQSEHEYFETIPFGSKVEEFYSRPVNAPTSEALHDGRSEPKLSAEEVYEQNQKEMVTTPSPDYVDPPVGSLVLERKVPLKLEPKVFFAVERTFLLWMHSALWLLGASMTIISFGYEDPQKLLYGALILPVALSFICYSLYQCEC